jgi:hypothetical protein
MGTHKSIARLCTGTVGLGRTDIGNMDQVYSSQWLLKILPQGIS